MWRQLGVLRRHPALPGSAFFGAMVNLSTTSDDVKEEKAFLKRIRNGLSSSHSLLLHIKRTGFCVVDDEVITEENRKMLLQLLGETRSSGYVPQSTAGRFHIDLMGINRDERDRIEEAATCQLQLLISDYFHQQGGQNEGQFPQLSQLQLLDSEPGSIDQFWHCDNTRRGLTILIPLVDMTLDNGPTQLLPGSHHVFPNADSGVIFPWSWVESASYVMNHSGKRRAPIRALTHQKTALVYDSRTLHRGLANTSNEARPVLILRYDREATPPPGVRLSGTVLIRVLANFFTSWAS